MARLMGKDPPDKFWFTTDGHMVLDTPYLAAQRLLPTFCHAYGLSGYEYWGLSWWTNNPWVFGFHKYSYNVFSTSEIRRLQWQPGEGYLTYPGHVIGQPGLVPSIRLEMVRDGIDDYDYYAILKGLIATNPLGLDVGPAQAALDDAAALVSMPNAGAHKSLMILSDPDAVLASRREVAEQILRLSPVIPEEDGGFQDDGGAQDDGGTPNDGDPDEDAVGPDEASDSDGSATPGGGCGCNSADTPGCLFLLGWLFLAGLVRRSRG
jgi:hypothetical protein